MNSRRDRGVAFAGVRKTRETRSGGVVVLLVGNFPKGFLLRVVEGVLDVSFVPSQTSAQGRDEVARLIGVVDGWDGELAHSDEDGVSALELAAVSTVEGDPRGAPRVLSDSELEFDAIRENHRTERERVRTNRRHQNGGYVRVHHRTTRGHAVRRGPGRRGDDDAVRLNRRDEVAAVVRLEIR